MQMFVFIPERCFQLLSLWHWGHFPFQQAQYARVFPLKPAPFCKLYGDLGSTNKSATSILLSDSFCPHHPVLFFYVNLSGRNCLLSPPVLSGYYGFPDTRFSRGTTRLMSRPDGERYSCPLQSLVVSLLLSLVSTFLGLEAYCLIKILRHAGSLDFHRGTCAPSLRLLCFLWSSLQWT